MQIKKIFEFMGILFTFLIAFSTQSCTNNIIFDDYKSISKSKWHKDSIIRFNINSIDTLSKNNIYVNIRNNKTYEFSNLFLIVGIHFPDNYQIVDTLEYEMTDADGRFLGDGISDILENKLEYKTNVSFPVKGNYQIQVQHAMRKSQNVEGLIYLIGIEDIGVAIEKIN